MYYYGTKLDSNGHYYWNIDDYFRNDYKIGENLPFNPYFIKGEKKGTSHFFQIFGYTGIAISGSPYDKRLGTVSVFFVTEQRTKEQMIACIRTTPIALQIIEKLGLTIDDLF